jgi:hypothetical protein
MKHHDDCKSWASFHPYDCPECKTLNDSKFFYSEKDLDRAYQEGADGYADEHEWEHQDEMKAAYDEGYADGKQAVLDSPEDFRLVKIDG